VKPAFGLLALHPLVTTTALELLLGVRLDELLGVVPPLLLLSSKLELLCSTLAEENSAELDGKTSTELELAMEPELSASPEGWRNKFFCG
jgi:hypothetical protein